MFIEVKKIKEVEVLDNHGSPVKDPTGNGGNLIEDIIQDECIDVWEIKAIRPFHNTEGRKKKYASITDPISVIYLHSSGGKAASSQLHVLGEYTDIKEEANALRSRSPKRDR